MKHIIFLMLLVFSFQSYSWTDDPLVPKVTPIKKIHIQEIREAIDALSCPNWEVSDWSPCVGGSGQWNYSTWGSCAGGTPYLQYSPWGACSASCAGGTQSRTYNCLFSTNSGVQTRNAQCAFNALSGSQTRTVSCRIDGINVDEALCARNPKPSMLQSCTPTNISLCGTVGPTSQGCTPTITPVCGAPVTSQICNTQSCCVPVSSSTYQEGYSCIDEAPVPPSTCRGRWCSYYPVWCTTDSCGSTSCVKNAWMSTSYMGCF